MPQYTEARIQQLCVEAIAAKSQSDVNRIIRELRVALQEHVRLAKDSLGLQASAIAVLNDVSRKDSQGA
jgi:hypothetical protein